MGGSKRIPLLVIGGGIGGLATALAASEAGYSAHVIERAPEFAEIGAGLQLAPNATRMLERLGIYGEIKKHAIFPKKLVCMDALSGERLTSLDLGEQFQEHYGGSYIVMHRADLLAVELEACRANDLITLESNKEAIEVTDPGNGARVRCSDGSIYECDALVGADGIWSRTRKVIHDDGEPICAEAVAYRGTIPVEESPKGVDRDNMTLWMGPDLHFVTYVVKHGELLNLVAVFRSNHYKKDSDDWGTVHELEEHFGAMCPQVQEGLLKIGRHRRWVMFDRLPMANWTRNRITLLGDAAHPMLQYAAQGACQALEDAVCLGDSLQKCNGDVERAFLTYQDHRLQRTARVQDAARFVGETFHAQGIARTFRNALLTKRAGSDFEYIEWLYGYRGCE